MGKLTKTQQRELQAVLTSLERGQNYLQKDDIVLATLREVKPGYKPLGDAFRDCPMQPDASLTPTNKHIGSDIAGIHSGIYQLQEFLKLHS